ncbi:MAG: S66 peptidase family protein [Actinomycetota bacterium]
MSSILNLPPALPRGGAIGIVAPASPGSVEVFERGLAAVESHGFRTVRGAHLFDRYGHLAGSDEDRAADLHEMFLRDDVDAILCARGGSGSIRLLRHLDWDLIAAHPKPFLGYSDITSLELAFLKRCGLPTFFAPMVNSDFAHDPWPSCIDLLWRMICEAEPAGEIADPRCAEATTLVGGVAEGPCVGGTLALVAATLGTEFAPDLDGCVFFFEDVHESPARMERYLTQLLLSGKLDHVAGFLIGNAPYEASDAERASYLPIEQVYADILAPLGKPLVYGWPHGHDPSPVTLPMGIRIRLDADRKSVTVLEAAVHAGRTVGR